MKIENQVCSLEQAKLLKELGIVQKSFFRYTADGQETHYLHWGEHTCEDDYAAFSCAELGEMLGKDCFSFFSVESNWNTAKWTVLNSAPLLSYYYVNMTTEAEARAETLIQLCNVSKFIIDLFNSRLTRNG